MAEVVHNKEAVCLAKAGQLLCILSDSLHLSVAVLDVTAISDPSVRLPFEATHIDCLFTLSNGMTVMTDIVSPETVVSDQFDFERTFEPCGNHWEIKDTQNPLGLHRRFRKLDHDGLVSELYRRQGQAFDMSGEMIQAISWFEQAIKRDPKNANACVSLGVAYGKSGALRKAIGYLELAIKQDPKNPPAYDNLGMCYEQLGEFHTAISWREKAIQLDDRFVKAHNNLGSVYYKLGDLKKALHYCGKANQLDPEHAPTHYNLGVIYRDLGDIRKAEHHYGEAHRLDPRRFGPRGYFS